MAANYPSAPEGSQLALAPRTLGPNPVFHEEWMRQRPKAHRLVGPNSLGNLDQLPETGLLPRWKRRSLICI
jgi:hypothetical protein